MSGVFVYHLVVGFFCPECPKKSINNSADVADYRPTLQIPVHAPRPSHAAISTSLLHPTDAHQTTCVNTELLEIQWRQQHRDCLSCFGIRMKLTSDYIHTSTHTVTSFLLDRDKCLWTIVSLFGCWHVLYEIWFESHLLMSFWHQMVIKTDSVQLFCLFLLMPVHAGNRRYVQSVHVCADDSVAVS